MGFVSDYQSDPDLEYAHRGTLFGEVQIQIQVHRKVREILLYRGDRDVRRYVGFKAQVKKRRAGQGCSGNIRAERQDIYCVEV